jgi:hypothetical protein
LHLRLTGSFSKETKIYVFFGFTNIIMLYIFFKVDVFSKSGESFKDFSNQISQILPKIWKLNDLPDFPSSVPKIRKTLILYCINNSFYFTRAWNYSYTCLRFVEKIGIFCIVYKARKSLKKFRHIFL